MVLINFQAVAAAAETLQLAGQHPSVRAVIAHLGGGSPNLVLKYLSKWKTSHPLVHVSEIDLAAWITSAINDQMPRVAVTAAAEERAAGIEEDLRALMEAQQAAERQIKVLTMERDAARQELEEAERNRRHADEQVVTLCADRAGERQQQEQIIDALAKAEVQIEALSYLQSKVERIRTVLGIEIKARIFAEQQTAILALKLEDAERRANKAEQQFQEMTLNLVAKTGLVR